MKRKNFNNNGFDSNGAVSKRSRISRKDLEVIKCKIENFIDNIE